MDMNHIWVNTILGKNYMSISSKHVYFCLQTTCYLTGGSKKSRPRKYVDSAGMIHMKRKWNIARGLLGIKVESLFCVFLKYYLVYYFTMNMARFKVLWQLSTCYYIMRLTLLINPWTTRSCQVTQTIIILIADRHIWYLGIWGYASATKIYHLMRLYVSHAETMEPSISHIHHLYTIVVAVKRENTEKYCKYSIIKLNSM